MHDSVRSVRVGQSESHALHGVRKRGRTVTAKRIDGRVRIEVRKDGMMLAWLTPATLISYALAHLGPVFREMHKLSFPYDIVTVIAFDGGEEFEHVETITEESDE